MTIINRIIKTALLLSALFLLHVSAYAQSEPNVEVSPVDQTSTSALLLVDGKLAGIENFDIIARGQQVMIWIRDLEKLGWGTVQRGDSTEKTVFKTKTVTLTFIKGKNIAMVNSLAVQLPIDVYLKSGKLMVPLSFVAKSLGYSFDLSLRPVATISTIPSPAIPKRNGIRGQVIYNGKGISGIKVALVDPDYNTVKGFQATTNADGDYAFDSVPNGKYLAYVWIGLNPKFFNRVSEEAELTDGKIARLKPIILGRIVHPIKPKADELIPLNNGKVVFEWTPCEGAQSYRLVITKLDSQNKLISLDTTKPRVEIVTKKLLPGVTYVADIEARDPDGRFLGGTIGSGGKVWTFRFK